MNHGILINSLNTTICRTCKNKIINVLANKYSSDSATFLAVAIVAKGIRNSHNLDTSPRVNPEKLRIITFIKKDHVKKSEKSLCLICITICQEKIRKKEIPVNMKKS